MNNHHYANSPHKKYKKVIKMTYTKAQIKDSVNRVVKFIQTNKKTPNTVRVNKDTLKWADWKKLAEIKDAETRLKKWINQHNEYPTYVNTCDVKVTPTIYKMIWTDLPKPSQPSIKHNTVSKYFEQKIGKFTTIDGALKLVDGKGYGHYYNDKMSNKQTIDNIAKKGASKPNCTDSCHLFWHIGKALGYEVRCVHIKCKSSGEGHVRLQFKHKDHTGGKWINRDPACVLSPNGKEISAIWCADGTVLAYNPKWFMDNLNR